MQVNHNNNFCRVFELPSEYPERYCFDKGHPVPFEMVDWFQPIPPEDIDQSKLRDWTIYESMLLNFLVGKRYVKPNKQYLLITEFGKAMIFKKGD